MPRSLLLRSLILNKMQCISIAFIDVNSVQFAYRAGIKEWIYIRFAKTFMWPSVNGKVDKSDRYSIRENS